MRRRTETASAITRICPNPLSNPYCHKKFDVNPNQPRKYPGLCDSCSIVREAQPETFEVNGEEYTVVRKLRTSA